MKKLLLTFILTSCHYAPEIQKVSPDTITEILSNTTYIKDSKMGFCYAVFQTAKWNDAQANTIAITWVPCVNYEKTATGEYKVIYAPNICNISGNQK